MIHQINDSRAPGFAINSQMSAEAVASDPMATAPRTTLVAVMSIRPPHEDTGAWSGRPAETGE